MAKPSAQLETRVANFDFSSIRLSNITQTLALEPLSEQKPWWDDFIRELRSRSRKCKIQSIPG